MLCFWTLVRWRMLPTMEKEYLAIARWPMLLPMGTVDVNICIYIYSIYALTNTIKDASKMCSTDIWNRVCAKESQLMSLQLPDAYCGILCAPYIGVWLPDFLSLIYDLFIEDYYALLVISILVQTNITAYARPGTSTQAHCVISNLSVVSSCQGRFIFWLVTSFV